MNNQAFKSRSDALGIGHIHLATFGPNVVFFSSGVNYTKFVCIIRSDLLVNVLI